MVNDARLAAGKKSLGFLNPWLYGAVHKAGALHDIMLGASHGCASGLLKTTPGWPALPGWDAATGLGSPDYPALVKAALQ